MNAGGHVDARDFPLEIFAAVVRSATTGTTASTNPTLSARIASRALPGTMISNASANPIKAAAAKVPAKAKRKAA